MIRKVASSLLLMLFILCSAISIMRAANIQKCWQESVSTILAPHTEEELSALEVSYPEAGWAAFQQAESQLIMGGIEGSRNSKASVLLFHGMPDSIAHFPMVAGHMPAYGENSVCALDKNTAFTLFSSVDVVGSNVNYDGNDWMIVGILDIDEPVLIAPGTAETVYDHFAVDHRETLTTLVTALGDDADPFSLSGSEMARLLWILCGLPWVLIILSGIRRIRRRTGGWKVVSDVAFCTALLGIVIALMYCVPVRLLPSRWSDLSFYGEQIRAFRNRPRSVPTIRDVLLGRDAAITCLWCALALITLRFERKVRSCAKS